MLKRFGFRRKMTYLCIAKRREPTNNGFSPLFVLKNSDFYLRGRKFYLRDKNFFGLGRNAKLRFRKFFGLQIIKNIKVFGPKNVGF